MHTLLFYVLCTTLSCLLLVFFFFNDTATTEIYTLSLHDALPILAALLRCLKERRIHTVVYTGYTLEVLARRRSEEHTSELQSHLNLVCRLLLEKKKITQSHLPDELDAGRQCRCSSHGRTLDVQRP